ncbi:MAG: GWxTD domain-containing protein, partial [Acidobacteriota bacterium]
MIAALRRAAHVVLATLVATSPLLPTVDAAAASLPPAADSGRGVPLPHTCPGGGYPGASRATTAHPPAVGALLAAAPVAAQEQQGEAPSRPPSGRWVHLGREAWRLEQLAEELTDASIPTPSAAAIQTALAEVGEQRWDDARKTLDRAIKRDPEEVSARYARALVRLRSPKPLKLEDVRKDLAVVVRLQPFFRNAFELWLLLTPTKDERKSMAHLLSNLEGKREGEAAGQIRWMRAALELQRGKPKDALRLLAKEPPEKAAPGAATQRALLVRMWALFDAEDDAAGQRLYFDLLEGADKQLMERFYRDAVLLVKEDEEKSFEAAEETDKVEWFRQFWTRRDPRPADELNPRIGEHYRRLSKARREYGLQSNGHGYFVDWQEFLKLTPELPYFAPSVVFDDQQASGYWIDHRGLWLVRHGEPDYAVKPRHSGNLHLDDNTTWLYSAFLPQPFVVHLVRRRALGEWVQVLNLGVAAAGSSSVDDEPVEVAGSMTGAFRQLYSSRADLDQLFLMITRADSLNRLISLLTSESKAMAGFAKSARIMDSTDYYSREDMLPMALSLVDWRRPDGQTDLEVEVAIDTRDIEWNQTGKEAAVELSLLLYDADWQGIVYRADRRYPVQSSDQQPGGTFITSFDAGAIEPGEYHYALQVNEPSSGRIGMARGTHAVDYYGTDWVDLSDLSLRVPVPGSPQGPNA